MNIGELAKASGVNAKLIRHYESIRLIPKATRTDAGYRVYSENDVHILRFIKRARSLGFGIKEIQKLISLWRNKSRASKEVKALVVTHLKELESKIAELQAMADALRHLAQTCHGDHRPDCPIIVDLETKGKK